MTGRSGRKEGPKMTLESMLRLIAGDFVTASTVLG